MTIDVSGLPSMEIAPRIDRLRQRFDDLGVDALLVTDLVNIRYLTGFTGSAALLVVGRDDLLFVSDGRYRDQSTEQLAAAGVTAEIVVDTGSGQKDAVARRAARWGRIGIEADHVSWAQKRTYAGEWFEDAELVATTGVVARLRERKDAGERARIAAACSVADEAFAAVKRRLAEHPSEREFALELEFEMRRRGAEAVSFDPIVASGPNGAKPHARPDDRVIGEGELVVLDFGCKVDGYCSDMTRTVSVGEPSTEARRMFEVVVESQRAGREAVRDGVDAAAVDRACRDVISEAGWGEAFLHSTGHGVGLEIHEEPRVAATAGGTLNSGHVVTVEPGVYLTGQGGVRIEDTVVVADGGCEVLTTTPKELVLG